MYAAGGMSDEEREYLGRRTVDFDSSAMRLAAGHCVIGWWKDRKDA
jgi:hypothetical protein